MSKPILLDLDRARVKLPIILMSFGIKSGLDFPIVDLYLDCRGCADPSREMSGTGDDPNVQAWVEAHSFTGTYRELIKDALLRLTTRRGAGKEFDNPFVILTMCAHGIHRSRAMKHILGRCLRDDGFQLVEVK